MFAWAMLTVGLAVRAFAKGLIGHGTAHQVVVTPQRVDLNTASVVELRLLPGVGPGRAESIVLERVRHGPFRGTADLERVDGIGPALVQAIEPFVTYGAPVR